MANQDKVYGLVICILNDKLELVDNLHVYSQLYAEINKTSDVLVKNFLESQRFNHAEVQGKFGAGKRALKYAISSDIPKEDREEQCQRAWYKFEELYFSLSYDLDHVVLKANLAEHIAMCFTLMNMPQNAKRWFNRAKDDNIRIGDLSDKVLSPWDEIAMYNSEKPDSAGSSLGWAFGMLLCGGPLAVPMAAVFTGQAAYKALNGDRINDTNEYNDQLCDAQIEARDNLENLNNLLAQIDA